MAFKANIDIPRFPLGGKGVYYRLIALWVLCEAMLGGIIHGFKIPVSGLVVGSAAIICICLIARYVPQQGSILKATLIVAIFKMMLSPQAPLPAYIAVFFQGMMGELLFWKRRHYALSCVLLGLLGLLESGVQKILMLTIVMGNDIWSATNEFINGLIGQKVVTNYSLWIAGIYLFLHLIAGLLVGWWAIQLPKKIVQWASTRNYDLSSDDTVVGPINARKKKRKVKKWLFVLWILLIGLYIQSYFNLGKPLLPSHISLKILLRSFIIVLGWVFLVGPLLIQLLHNWLKKKESSLKNDVQNVLHLLPETRQLITACWKQSSIDKGVKRWRRFSRMIAVNSLRALHTWNQSNDALIYILTAPIQSGKTTSLLRWAHSQPGTYGILTPVVEGERVFNNLESGEKFAMEARAGEEAFAVGKFLFSKKGFESAIAVIRKNINCEGWLIIDEIGPLELKDEGFSSVLREVLALRTGKLLLVVRDGLVEKVKEDFGISKAIVITSIEELTQDDSENVVSSPRSA